MNKAIIASAVSTVVGFGIGYLVGTYIQARQDEELLREAYDKYNDLLVSRDERLEKEALKNEYLKEELEISRATKTVSDNGWTSYDKVEPASVKPNERSGMKRRKVTIEEELAEAVAEEAEIENDIYDSIPIRDQLDIQEETNSLGDGYFDSPAVQKEREAIWDADVFLDGREDNYFPYPPSKLGEDIMYYTVVHRGITSKSIYPQDVIDDRKAPAPYIYDVDKFDAWAAERETAGEGYFFSDVAYGSILEIRSCDVYLDNVDFAHPENSGNVVANFPGFVGTFDDPSAFFGPHSGEKFASVCEDERARGGFRTVIVNEVLGWIIECNVYEKAAYDPDYTP